jgi:hypothetical protein
MNWKRVRFRRGRIVLRTIGFGSLLLGFFFGIPAHSASSVSAYCLGLFVGISSLLILFDDAEVSRVEKRFIVVMSLVYLLASFCPVLLQD